MSETPIDTSSLIPKNNIPVKKPFPFLQKRCPFCHGIGHLRPFIICDKCHGTGIMPLIEPVIY